MTAQSPKAPSPFMLECETAITDLVLAVDARATILRSNPHKRDEAESNVAGCRRSVDRAIALVVAEARDAVHARLQDLVDTNFGVRPTKSTEQLLDILEKELPAMAAQIREDTLMDAIAQCESEKRACEKLVERFPKNAVHATGVLIADVCRRRILSLVGDDADSDGAES